MVICSPTIMYPCHKNGTHFVFIIVKAEKIGNSGSLPQEFRIHSDVDTIREGPAITLLERRNNDLPGAAWDHRTPHAYHMAGALHFQGTPDFHAHLCNKIEIEAVVGSAGSADANQR